MPVLAGTTSDRINGQRGFYCLRKTAATEIEKITPPPPLVTETFLAHAERGMKRHHAERHFELLDEALVRMETLVGNGPPPVHELTLTFAVPQSKLDRYGPA